MVLLGDACPGNIYWLAANSITTTTSSTIYGNLIAYNSITSYTATTINGRVYAQTNTIAFTGATTANAVVCSIPCYVKGTQVLTKDGYKAIEDLHVDELVLTQGLLSQGRYIRRNSKFRPIRSLFTFTIGTPDEVSHPICFKKNSLGPSMPNEDLFVSPNHSMIVNEKKIAAHKLVNGTTIFQDTSRSSVQYYRVELETHSAIVANGTLSESFLATAENKRVSRAVRA